MDETLLESVLDQLKECSVAQLGEVCVTLDLLIPPTKAGKLGPIKNIIRNHLTSEDIEESEDNGLAMLKAVENDFVNSMLLEQNRRKQQQQSCGESS